MVVFDTGALVLLNWELQERGRTGSSNGAAGTLGELLVSRRADTGAATFEKT